MSRKEENKLHSSDDGVCWLLQQPPIGPVARSFCLIEMKTMAHINTELAAKEQVQDYPEVQ